MKLKIVDLSEVSFENLIEFYAKNGEAQMEWYVVKFERIYNSGLLLGSLCIDIDGGEIIGAYLGVQQQLLCNKNLMAVQSIDTLIAHKARGGGILKKLAVHYYSMLVKRGFNCVFGMPNKNIEQLRYRLLGWNKSRDIYFFVSYFPAPILRLFSKLFRFAHDSPNNLESSRKQAFELEKKYKLSDHILFSSDGSIVSATYDTKLCTKVGLIRYRGKNTFLKRFKILCAVAERGTGFFLTTYATIDSETASYFNHFSVKKRSSPFCGLILNNDPPYSFGEQSFEFIEFDTFGII
jgi:hypothetical protein